MIFNRLFGKMQFCTTHFILKTFLGVSEFLQYLSQSSDIAANKTFFKDDLKSVRSF